MDAAAIAALDGLPYEEVAFRVMQPFVAESFSADELRAAIETTPARKLRDRFSREIAERLIALAWWDWPHEQLHAALADFRKLSAEEFLDRYETASRSAVA